MKKKRSKTKSIADLEALADQDGDISQFFGPHKIASGMAMAKREMGDQIRRNIEIISATTMGAMLKRSDFSRCRESITPSTCKSA